VIAFSFRELLDANMSAKGRFHAGLPTGRLIFDGISMRWDNSAPQVVDSSAQSTYCTADGRPVANEDGIQHSEVIPMANDRYLESKKDDEVLSVNTSLVSLKDSVSVRLEPEIPQYNRLAWRLCLTAPRP
jgi:hypothetical protein